MKVMRNEKDVKAAVKKLFEKHNWFWWMPPANGFGKVGVSDFNAIKDGVFIAVETKFGSNKPTVHQKAFLESVAAESGFGFVVTDQNIGWLETFLDNFSAQVKEVSQNKQMSNEAGATLVDAIRALTALI